MSKSPSMSRNVIAYWLAFAYAAFISFFLSPYIVHHLGDSAYGVWTLLSSLVGYLGLLDLGIRGAVTRYVAHHHAAKNTEQASSIVSAALVMFGLLGAAAIVIAGTTSLVSPHVFNIPDSLAGDTRAILLIGGISMASTLIGAVFGGVVIGLQRFDVSSAIEVCVTTLRTVAVVVALTHGFGLVTLAVIHLTCALLQGIASWMAARRLYPELRFRVKGPLLPHMRTILSFSVFLSVIHIFGALIYYSDAMVIAVFLPVAAVTHFAIAGSLCEYARQTGSALSMLMTPRVSAMASVGSNKVGAEILSSARVATLITAPIAAIFIVRGESFINLWMGFDYGEPSGQVLLILAITVMLGGARAVASSSIIGLNKHRNLIPILGVEAACNLALSVALVGSYGIVGVALGTMIPSSIISVAFIPRVLYRVSGVPVRQFGIQAWLRPLVACLGFIAANMLLEEFLPAGNLAIFFAQIFCTLPLVVAGAYLVCLAPEEKQWIAAALREALGRRRG